MTYQDFSERFEYDPDDDLLGEGGFGKIYKAWDHVRNEFVAVKTSKVLPDYEEFSLMQEYELVRLLEHPNIARYIDCKRIKFPNTGTHDVALMKYYEYGNLSQLLSNHLLSDPQKQTLIDGLLAGINYLHTQQPIIIHRDLKPSNILVVKRGEKYIPLITDFGISRKAKMNDISFITNTVGAGTYMYAAPEQWEAKELRPNADLWSFGIISAYIWLNGKKLPFRAEDIDVNTETGRMEYKRRLLSLDFAQEINNIPEPYQTVIRKCLVVDPLQRIKTAKEVKALLEGNKQPITVNIPKGKDVSVPIGGDEATKLLPRKDKNPKEVKVSPPEKVTPPEIKPIKRNNERIWYGVVAVGLLLIGLAGWYLKNKEVGPIVLPTTDSTSFNKVKKDTIDSKTSLPTKDANGKPTELVAAAKIETPPKAKETIPEGAVAKTRQTVAKAEIPPSQDNTIYTDVDQVPQYPGGQEALREFLENNLTYPPAASKSYISGKVIVSFIVNTNGNLQDVRVTKSLGYGCDEEALRLVRSMPNWKPGRQDNKVVRVRYSVPVSFVLN